MTGRLALEKLVVTGPKGKNASIDFVSGLNVIQGAANTGKSHIVALINFLLGASTPPTWITEQDGYDTSFLSLKGNRDNAFTLARMLSGGDFRIVDTVTQFWPEQGQRLAAKHKTDGSSVSEYLLDKLEMKGKRLRKNARGETVSLSFRHIAHLSLIPEGKIQSEVSPVETGQYISRTVDFSAFKYLLTGYDDALVEQVRQQRPDTTKRAHQLELLDRQLMEVSSQIEKTTSDPDDLRSQDERILAAIADELTQLETTGSDYKELTVQRRQVRKTREHLSDRNDEIALLIARFRLLEEHYKSDVERLAAIGEAGTFFLLRDSDTCPVCGARAEHQHKDACEADVEQIRAAAEAEIKRINVRQEELQDVIARLNAEAAENSEQLEGLEVTLADIEQRLSIEIPDVRSAKHRLDRLISTRTGVQMGLSLVQRQLELQSMRSELGDEETDATSLIAEAVISPQMKDDFAKTIEDILDMWGYPTNGRVFFDLKTRDIEIAGKPRKANGKGVRAVLHAAFSIGLAQHCIDKGLPHPGFVLLDLPLVTYRDPIEPDEKKLAKTDLRSRFFESLRSLPKELQVVIFENVDLPAWLVSTPGATIFTGVRDTDASVFTIDWRVCGLRLLRADSCILSSFYRRLTSGIVLN